MSTLPRMRTFLRDAAFISGAMALTFFCSCERHHPDELPVEEHASSGAAARERPAHEKKSGAHLERQDDQHRATTAMSVTPAPTPAQFFPTASPH